MKLIDNWFTVLTRAWSARLAALAAVLGALEFALPYFAPVQPSGKFAAFAGLVSLLAALSRVVAQPVLQHDLAVKAETQPVPLDEVKQ